MPRSDLFLFSGDQFKEAADKHFRSCSKLQRSFVLCYLAIKEENFDSIYYLFDKWGPECDAALDHIIKHGLDKYFLFTEENGTYSLGWDDWWFNRLDIFWRRWDHILLINDSEHEMKESLDDKLLRDLLSCWAKKPMQHTNRHLCDQNLFKNYPNWEIYLRSIQSAVKKYNPKKIEVATLVDKYFSKRLIQNKNDIEVIGNLGHGINKTLKLCKFKGCEGYVLISFHGKDVKNVNELFNWCFLEHPNIMKLEGFYFDNDRLYGITKYQKNGNLSMFLNKNKNIDIKNRVSFIMDLLIVLEYLHYQSLYHGDLKPQNILVSDNGKILLTDFGSSKKLMILKNSKSMKNISKYQDQYFKYDAIENKQEKDSLLLGKSDVYSFAAVAIYILTGKNPWCEAKSNMEFFAELNKTSVPPEFKDIPENFRNENPSFIKNLKRCFDKDLNKRPTIKELSSSLKYLEECELKKAEIKNSKELEKFKKLIKRVLRQFDLSDDKIEDIFQQLH